MFLQSVLYNINKVVVILRFNVFHFTVFHSTIDLFLMKVNGLALATRLLGKDSYYIYSDGFYSLFDILICQDM